MGRDDGAESGEAGDDRRDRLARVVRVEHGWCLVAADADADADAETERVRCHLPVAVGDWVRLTPGEDAAVEDVAERRTALTRLDPSGLTQVLAANVDVVLVTAPADRPSAARVEREVAMGWDSGATPVVLITKSDLDDGTLAAELTLRLAGVDVHEVSGLTGDGIDTVRELLRPDRTAVLLGPSGAGKSTLVNMLLGREATVTGAVRESDHRGRHSTTFRELHRLPGGGFLIDTPGLRSLALTVDEDAVAATFPDVAELAADCRFRDCSHEHEPGCAVIEAVDTGELSPERLDSYRKIARELDYQRRRDDPLAAREARAVLKARSKAVRHLFKERGSH